MSKGSTVLIVRHDFQYFLNRVDNGRSTIAGSDREEAQRLYEEMKPMRRMGDVDFDEKKPKTWSVLMGEK